MHTVFVWGFHGSADVEQLQVSEDSADARLVSGGFGFCATLLGGRLRVRGGRGYVVDTDVKPESLSSSDGAAAVCVAALGWEHALCATDDGTLLGWGWNAHRQAGSAAVAELEKPTPFPCSIGAPVRALAAGETHSLALVGADGAVFAWGGGSCGQLGHGDRGDVSSPRRVERLPLGVTAIAAGARHSLAALPTGGVAAFGWGLYGQLGNGGNEDALAPEVVLSGIRCSYVAAGLAHSMFLTATGDVYACGFNDAGQLGLACSEEGGAAASSEEEEHTACALTPELLESPLLEARGGVRRVCCGARHTVFLMQDARVAACGWNAHGQLCTGDRVDRHAPTLVALPRAARDVECGWWHTLVLLEPAGDEADGKQGTGAG
jgi:alpha-tubulin suppressor-like RCC1 family protein